MRRRIATLQKTIRHPAPLASSPKEGGGGEKCDPAEHRGLDELDRHLGVTPVVESVKASEEQHLRQERERRTALCLTTASALFRLCVRSAADREHG